MPAPAGGASLPDKNLDPCCRSAVRRLPHISRCARYHNLDLKDPEDPEENLKMTHVNYDYARHLHSRHTVSQGKPIVWLKATHRQADEKGPGILHWQSVALVIGIA